MSKYFIDSNPSSSLFQSQEDIFAETTPRDSEHYTNVCFNANSNVGNQSGIKTLAAGGGPSPMRKKRGSIFTMFGRNTSTDSNINLKLSSTDPNSMTSDINDENSQSFFNISQDSMGATGNTQLSQDFSDRFCQFNMRSSQDNNANCSSSSSHSIPFFPIDSCDSRCSNYSNDAFTLPPPPSFTIDRAGGSSSSDPTLFSAPLLKPDKKDTVEAEKQIVLRPPLPNPFLQPISSSALKSSKTKKHSLSIRRPTTLWIAPYKERPRLVTDFEMVRLMGEGAFSVVYCVRRRLDGMLYAVKKLKSKITGENDGKHTVKESCAHAVLVGCPNLVRYFSCWIDDGYLHIQTELCAFGSLDRYISRCSSSFPIPINESQLSKQKENMDDCSHSQSSNCFLYDSQDMPSQLTAPMSSNPFNLSVDSIDSGIPEPLAWLILLKIGESLSFMHKKGIAHLDLRPANIFISGPIICSDNDDDDDDATVLQHHMHSLSNNSLTEGLLSGKYTLKLGDLGHATRIDDDSPIEEGEGRYCARELIAYADGGMKLDMLKADMFSLGASLYELCLGRMLGSGGVENSWEWHSIRDGILGNAFRSKYSDRFVEIIQRLLHPSFELRPSADYIISNYTL